MSSAGIVLRQYWPILVVAAAAAMSAAVDNFRIQLHAEQIDEIDGTIEEHEDELEAIQRLLIRRQGEVELDVQRIQQEQRSQGETLDEILRILQQRSNQ